MDKINAGDVVQLKSGGPLMTVRFVDGDQAYCEWFDKSKNEGAKFALLQLEKIEDQ